MTKPLAATAAFLCLLTALGCGGEEVREETGQDADSTTASTTEEGLHPLRLYGGAEDGADEEGAGVVHSGAFLILEDARSTVDEANESIRELETSLEEIR